MRMKYIRTVETISQGIFYFLFFIFYFLFFILSLIWSFSYLVELACDKS
jgi:hypothetical protein